MRKPVQPLYRTPLFRIDVEQMSWYTNENPVWRGEDRRVLWYKGGTGIGGFDVY